MLKKHRSGYSYCISYFPLALPDPSPYSMVYYLLGLTHLHKAPQQDPLPTGFLLGLTNGDINRHQKEGIGQNFIPLAPSHAQPPARCTLLTKIKICLMFTLVDFLLSNEGNFLYFPFRINIGNSPNMAINLVISLHFTHIFAIVSI